MIRWVALVLLLVASPVLADQDGPTTVYGYRTIPETFGVFTINYPAGRWNLSKEVNGDRASFRLESKSTDRVVLQLMLTGGLPKEDAHYDNNPQLVNDAALLPIALKLAGDDQSRILMSIGTAATPEFVGTSSRAAVLLEDNKVANLEACNFLVRDESNSHLALGIVITESLRGQVRQDVEYVNRVAEAFAIIQAIEVSVAQSVQ